MTPKEKAKELFDKYQIAGSQWYVDTTKKYALITVDEIIEIIDHTPLADRDYEEHLIKYWQQVREEIINL